MTGEGRTPPVDLFKRYPVEPGPTCDAEAKACLSAVLPDAFVAQIEAHGFCSAANRRHQFLDPRRFESLVAQMFKGDPDIDASETVVVATEAFGDFSLWSRTHFVMHIDIHKMHLSASEIAPHDFGGMPLPKPRPGREHLRYDPTHRARLLVPMEVHEINFWDPFNTPIFDLAQKTLGPLEAGEIYAFDPPLFAAAGAIPRHPLDRLCRVKACDALETALAVSPLSLVRFVRGRPEVVRPVGPGLA